MTQNKSKAGRKGKYYTNVLPKLETITGWARDGLSDEQIARNLDISHESFYKYKREHTEFSDALKRGKEDAIYEVENALFKTAIGYYYTEEEVTKSGAKVDVTRYSKPNTTAQIFFLKNKRPDEWREKTESKIDLNNLIQFVGEDEIED